MKALQTQYAEYLRSMILTGETCDIFKISHVFGWRTFQDQCGRVRFFLCISGKAERKNYYEQKTGNRQLQEKPGRAFKLPLMISATNLSAWISHFILIVHMNNWDVRLYRS